MKQRILIGLTLVFIVWAFVEQTQEYPRIWVQVLGVLLFFYGMMRLSTKVNQTERQRLAEEALRKETEAKDFKNQDDAEERR